MQPAVVDAFALVSLIAALDVRDRAAPLQRSGRRDGIFTIGR
jgi:hypothetical protein